MNKRSLETFLWLLSMVFLGGDPKGGFGKLGLIFGLFQRVPPISLWFATGGWALGLLGGLFKGGVYLGGGAVGALWGSKIFPFKRGGIVWGKRVSRGENFPSGVKILFCGRNGKSFFGPLCEGGALYLRGVTPVYVGRGGKFVCKP